MRSSRALVICAGLAGSISQAYAQPVTHPLWATTPDAEWDKAARAQFEIALQRRGLGPLAIVAIERPADPRLGQRFAEGMTAFRALAYDRAAAILTDAARLARENGGEGLAPGEIASLFFHQAVAIQLASGATYSEPFTSINPEAARDAYLEAAVLDPGRTYDDTSAYPVVEMSWRLALTTVRQRARGALTVRAHPRAKISIDGRPFVASPATLFSLPFGEHFIRVEEPGHAPWATVITLAQPSAILDVPATPLLVYDGAKAADQARAKGASYALLGQLHLGDKIEIDVRLFDARTNQLCDASAVEVSPKLESPDLIAAVLRLDEVANRARVARRANESGQSGSRLPMTVPPERRAREDGAAFSGGWLRRRWPLVTAIGVAAGTAVVLGILVANDKTSPASR